MRQQFQAAATRSVTAVEITLVAITSTLAILGRGYVAAGIIGVVAFAIYIESIRRQETKPSQAAWTFYLIAYTFWLIVQLFDGTPPGLWLIIAELVGIVVTVILAFCYYGTGSMDSLDKKLLALAFAGIAAWIITRSADLSVSIQFIVEWIANFSNANKTYEMGAESVLSWYWVVAAGLMGLLGLEGSPAILYLLPITILLGAMLMLRMDALRSRNYERAAQCLQVAVAS